MVDYGWPRLFRPKIQLPKPRIKILRNLSIQEYHTHKTIISLLSWGKIQLSERLIEHVPH